MKILVTGAKGQLGSEINELKSKYPYEFFFTDIDELDLTDEAKLSQYIKKIKPDILINCAGYTAVDKAEEEIKQANAINVNAVKLLAELSVQHKFTMIHFSTDYVFDGKSNKPYTENDTANPKTIYGKSKFNGEIEVLFNAYKAIIIRTSWLYSVYGNNFVKTIIKNAKEKGKLSVVCDQIGCPTYAEDLAKAVLDHFITFNSTDKCEIFNYANEGVASWYDFAKEIVDIAKIKCDISAIETKDYPTAAARPLYSVLNKSKFKTYFKTTIPYWRDSLKICVEKFANH